MEMLVQNLIDSYMANTGKMIRPQLIKLFGDIFQLSNKDTLLISRAAEMIHNASLIHDDVIDEAETRRGQKALNQLVSNSKAVLAGDFLLAKVIAELVESHQFGILKTLAETLQNIVEGEFLQDELKSKEVITFDELREVAEKKTGALLAWCCSAAAIVANKDPTTIETCRKIGLNLGRIFQLIDDNLDYSEETGKDFAKDLKEGLINTTTLKLITLYPELYYPVHQLRKSHFQQVPWSNQQMDEAKLQIQNQAESIMADIGILLGSLKDADTTALSQLMGFLITRQK